MLSDKNCYIYLYLNGRIQLCFYRMRCHGYWVHLMNHWRSFWRIVDLMCGYRTLVGRLQAVDTHHLDLKIQLLNTLPFYKCFFFFTLFWILISFMNLFLPIISTCLCVLGFRLIGNGHGMNWWTSIFRPYLSMFRTRQVRDCIM